ncbi:MAG: hypothetical protein JW873_03445 [Candidatus Saganbacteria bacterium]|nr:hypothetical protein [Candidatus Saganbacteria bacterium]
MTNYFRTDTKQNAFDSLEKAAFFLGKTNEDINWCKWTIIALHSALYGFMVCALEGSAGFSTYPDYVTEKLLKFYSLPPENRQKNGKFPEVKLDYFWSLYEKIKSPTHMNKYYNSKTFVPKNNIDWNINKLNKIRNEFLHFTPKGWSLELNGIPQIVDDANEIIGFLVFDFGNISIQPDEKSLAQKMLTELREESSRLAASLGTQNKDGKAEEIAVVEGVTHGN